ncbi:hypothetical protein ACLKA7_015198 [Drosophila subpalustris]
MAKIAVVFLLVAVVAICNGARVARDTPAKPEVDPLFQPVVDNLQKLFSQENIDKVRAETEALIKKGQETSENALDAIIEYGKKLQEDLKKKKTAA